ncbi:MAG TPA: DEAD/DEAH box helicase, partial [Microlunatus sp.]
KKHRWTAAERAERGHRPRRRGQAGDKPAGRSDSFDRGSRFDRADRGDRNQNWDRSKRDRNEDRGRDGGWDRSDGRDRSQGRDRGRSWDRAENRDRGQSWGRDRNSDRTRSSDRNDGRDRSQGRDRGRSWDRNDRSDRSDRNDRSDRWDRKDRSDRDQSWDRGGRSDRNQGRDRNDGSGRSQSWGGQQGQDRYEGRDRNRNWDRKDGSDRTASRGRNDSWDRADRSDRNQDRDRSRSWDRNESRDRSDRSDRNQGWNSDRDTNRNQATESVSGLTDPRPTVDVSTAGNVSTPAPISAHEGVGFAELGVAQPLVDRLAADGIAHAFPIQAASIPDAVAGRDVLGRGRTGSGKTLGFGLPLLTRLASGHRNGHDPRGLILLPTRELATQVSDVLTPLARAVGLRTQLVAGGMSYAPQLKGLERGVDIVIGTPGRLIDLMDRGALLLGSVQITVLDEADHMADLGFLPDVTTLLNAVPGDGQRMLFSATLDRGIDRLVQTYLHDPSTHEVDSAQASVDTMEHFLLPVAPADKRPITAEIANRDGRTVIFVRTQLGADRVAEQLRESGVMAGALHGGLPQGARNRTLEAFKTGSLPVLVATDVAARGIHVDEVGLVLQVDPPTDPKTYLHRAGRTARAGQTGVVVTLVLPNQRRQVRRLAKDAGVAATELDARPGDPALSDATGAAPSDGPGIGEREYAKLIAPRQSARSGRGPRRGPGRGPGQRDDRPAGRSDRGRGDRSWGERGKQTDRGWRNGSGRQSEAAYHSGR